MASDENKKNRIMDFAFKKFTSIGISQITMDDIARGVGMGKGTLYRYFPSKEVLVLHTIDFFAGRVEKSIEEVLSNQKLTTEHKLNLFLKMMAQKLAMVNPNVLEYLERSMPEAYEKIQQTRERIIMNKLVRLFEDGKKSGLFDPQMDERLVAHMMIGAVNHIVNTHVLSNMDYTFDKLFTAITSVILKGCMTEEGRKMEG